MKKFNILDDLFNSETKKKQIFRLEQEINRIRIRIRECKYTINYYNGLSARVRNKVELTKFSIQYLSTLKYAEEYEERLIKDLKSGKFGFYIHGSKGWNYGNPLTYVYIPVHKDTSPSYLSKLLQKEIINIISQLPLMKNALEEKLNELEEAKKRFF